MFKDSQRLFKKTIQKSLMGLIEQEKVEEGGEGARAIRGLYMKMRIGKRMMMMEIEMEVRNLLWSSGLMGLWGPCGSVCFSSCIFSLIGCRTPHDTFRKPSTNT